MITPVFIDPEETIPVGLDFSAELAELVDTIAGAQAEAEGDVQVVDGSVAHAGGVARCFVTPVEDPASAAAVKFTIATTLGSTLVRRLPLVVREL